MKRHLNLLPMATRRKQLIQKIIKQWTLATGLATVFTSLFVWFAWERTSEQLSLLDSAKRQYAPLKALETDNIKLAGETESLNQRERLALELAQNRSTLTLLGQLSFAANRCDGKVSIRQFSMNTTQRESADDKGMTFSETKLMLQGVAIDDISIAQFVAELRDSKMFYDVQLTSTGSSKIEDKESKLYTLECVY